MLNNLLKTITVLALTIGGSVVAMQQNQRPAGQRPRMVCSGGQCRLVQPQAQAAAPAARGVATATTRGGATIGLTPAQSAAQKAQFNALLGTQGARSGMNANAPAAAQRGGATIGLTPAQSAAQKAQFNALLGTQGARSGVNANAPAAAQQGYVAPQGYVGIPVPR
jgi:hypothetical protein